MIFCTLVEIFRYWAILTKLFCHEANLSKLHCSEDILWEAILSGAVLSGQFCWRGFVQGYFVGVSMLQKPLQQLQRILGPQNREQSTQLLVNNFTSSSTYVFFKAINFNVLWNTLNTVAMVLLFLTPVAASKVFVCRC